jgi:hypothetical protein
MPLSPTPNMALVLPTIAGDPNAWGGYLNTALAQRVDVHDHQPGNGVRVPVAGMRFNADVNLNDAGVFRAITNARALGLDSQLPANVAGVGACVFRNLSDAGNFYLRTAAGQLVRINNGAALDISGAGGFLGDYTTVGADARYDDASDSYWFRQQQGGGVNQYARIRASDFDFYEYKAHPAAAPPANRVRVGSPAALAASYALTLPPALPGSAGLLWQVSTGGVITFGNTGLQAITMAASQSISTSGNVVLSGTGEVKHGTRTKNVSIFGGYPTNLATDWVVGGSPTAITATGLGVQWLIPIDLTIGDRILAIRFYFQRAGGTLTFAFRRKTVATGAEAVQASTTSAAGTAYAIATIAAVNYTLVVTEGYFLSFTAGASGDVLHHVQIDYDRP